MCICWKHSAIHIHSFQLNAVDKSNKASVLCILYSYFSVFNSQTTVNWLHSLHYILYFSFVNPHISTVHLYLFGENVCAPKSFIFEVYTAGIWFGFSLSLTHKSKANRSILEHSKNVAHLHIVNGIRQYGMLYKCENENMLSLLPCVTLHFHVQII